MNWGQLTAGLITAAALAAPAMAAPLFPDVPDNHWATDAVKTLAAKGVIEGYPDGTFKGDRASTRWEVAMVVARLLAKMEQEHASFATKAELDELQRLAESLRSELDALGVRVGDLEKKTAELDLRVSELERIRFYGRLHAKGVSNIVAGDTDAFGTINTNTVDWSTGRVLIDGDGFSMMGLLGVNADISDDVSAGLELVGYVSGGNQAVDAYWGITAPFNCNPWTARNGPFPGAQSENNLPFTRMVLDNFWIYHKPSDTKFIGGSFYTNYMGGFVFEGPRNPSISYPMHLPMYGFDLNGSLFGVDSGIKYEAFYSAAPDRARYHTNSIGGTLRYEFANQRGHASVHGVQHRNENITDGIGSGAGLIPLPTLTYVGVETPPVTVNSWMGIDAAGNPMAHNIVGPQSEFTVGADVSYLIEEDHKISINAEYGTSTYNPDTTSTLFNTHANGSMYRISVGAVPIEGLNLNLEYMHVDPDYDPFMVQYPITAGIPVFVPYGGYYSEYYQMHDYVNLPNNREGFKFFADYTFNESATRVYALYSAYDQVKVTTQEQAGTVGNIEPLFSVLVGPCIAKGHVNSLGIGGSHNFDCGLNLDLTYFNYDIRRKACPQNDINLVQNVYNLNLAYPLTDQVKLRAGYQYMDYSGHTGIYDSDFSQSTPSIGVDYQMTQDLQFSLDYRYMDVNQKAYENGDYKASQIVMEMKMDF
ncbi:MAG: S-layer homology domain-containing protein [bacterium]|nr:S-layer homology domain-containing protein [bacterium]